MSQHQVSLTESAFGDVDGAPVTLFTFRSTSGLSISLCSLGCTITQCLVPDRGGAVADIVLAYDSVDAIRGGLRNFGSIVGRYANRIALGKFTLDGQEYELPLNNGPNHLHGGPAGFCDKVFAKRATSVRADDMCEVVLEYTSPDGEQGYPGELAVTATFSLDTRNRFTMQFRATTTKATVCNLCNHAYWNLAGHDASAPQSLFAHTLQLGASKFTPNNEHMIPFGCLESVVGTPFDFTAARAIGQNVHLLFDDAKSGGGYDLNFALDRVPKSSGADAHADGREFLTMAATLHDPASGRTMVVETNAPGVQVYTANWLETTGKGGVAYEKYGGVCLETQHFPNSPNTPAFPSPVLRPGELYRHDVVHTFSW